MHRIGDWSACSASCGGGTQSRAVTCITAAGTPSNECAGAAPASVRVCNAHRCESYSWSYTAWSECSATCGSGSVRTRQALCRSSAGRVAPGSRCLRSRAPAALSETCTGLPDCGAHRWSTGAWGSCSKTCGGGIVTRPVECLNATGHVVAESECAGLPKPAFTRTCNTFPCIAYAWGVSEWSSCSRACFGVQTRAVSCVGGVAALETVSSSLCDATQKPATSQACSTSDSCDFCHDNTCSGRGTCENGECTCTSGFTGAYCHRSVECAGYFDRNGTCCLGVLMPDSSCCSGSSALIDATGTCCPSGQVDACGVCEGSGVAVDLNGKCCTGGVDARGFCCDTEVDACGVCGGQGACSQAVTVLVDADLGDEVAAMTTSQLRAAMADADSDARIALEFGARGFVAAALGRDEGRMHVTDVVVPNRRRLGADMDSEAGDGGGSEQAWDGQLEELLHSLQPHHGRHVAEQRVLQTTIEVDSAGDVRVPNLITPSALQSGFDAHAAASPDAAVVVTSLVASSAIGGTLRAGHRLPRPPFTALTHVSCA